MSRRRDRGQIRKSVANRAAPFIDNGPRQVAKDVRDLMGATAGALGTRDGGVQHSGEVCWECPCGRLQTGSGGQKGKLPTGPQSPDATLRGV